MRPKPIMTIFQPTADAAKITLMVRLNDLRKKIEQCDSWHNGPGKELLSAILNVVIFDDVEMEW